MPLAIAFFSARAARRCCSFASALSSATIRSSRRVSRHFGPRVMTRYGIQEKETATPEMRTKDQPTLRRWMRISIMAVPPAPSRHRTRLYCERQISVMSIVAEREESSAIVGNALRL